MEIKSQLHSLSAESLHQITACPDCDLLVRKQPLKVGGKAKCPRCGCVLYTNKPNSVDRSLAFSISGLILFVPANVYPLLSLDFSGRVQHGTVMSGIIEMYQAGISGVATLVLFCAVIIPLVKLVVITFILGCVRLSVKLKSLILLFRFYRAISVWGMLEIFLLAILLSCLKLIDDADVIFRGGFFAFSGLMACAVMISATLDEGYIWRHLDRSFYD